MSSSRSGLKLAAGCRDGIPPANRYTPRAEHRRVPFGHEREVAASGFRPGQAGHARKLSWNRHAGAGQKAPRDFPHGDCRA